MRFLAVLNRDGGTLRTTDIDTFSRRARQVFEDAGHQIDFDVVSGDGLSKALENASKAASVDTVIVGGGDGTISSAAGVLMNSKKSLAILPAGTMNLFARSLKIPQQLDSAMESFADGEVMNVDIATANGKPFVHQFSIGLHAKMVDLRDKMEFKSRLGKMGASMKAAFLTLKDPPSIKVELAMRGKTIRTRSSGVGVTNNVFGEGHLPYADRPDGGVLGIYITRARGRGGMILHALNMLRGKWRDNPHVDIHETEKVDIRLQSTHRKFACVIDGELYPLENHTEIRIFPGALRVLVPRTTVATVAA